MTSRERKDELAQQDRKARAQVQRDFSLPLVLEAGAGTGKTTILTARVVAWCLGQGWEKAEGELGRKGAFSREKGHSLDDEIASRVLSRIVAITFTEAAAAEMASRIAEAFTKLVSGSVPEGVDGEVLPSDHEIRSRRARALLVNLDRLSIQTIHAFCLALLRRFPLEAGLHPNVTVDADGLLVKEMAREIVNLHFSEALANGDEDLVTLMANGLSPNAILEALVALASQGVPVEALRQGYFSPERIADLVTSLLDGLVKLLDHGGAKLSKITTKNSKSVKAVRALALLMERLKEIDPSSGEGLQKVSDGLPKNWKEEIERLSHWANKDFNRDERKVLDNPEELAQQAARVVRWVENLPRIKPVSFRTVQRTLGQLLQSLYERMRSRGVVTFGWILQMTRTLLRENPNVLSQVRRSMDQLLVDEFQDTDRLQCEILKMIALEGPADARPGLFIVGDPKQSIYGWRNADLAAYKDFMAELYAEGGKKLLLSVNFRSAPPILEEVERVMQNVMVERPGIQPRFEPLVPCQEMERLGGFSIHPWSPVEYWVSNFKMNPREEKVPASRALSREARALAMDLVRLHEEAKVPWSEIGILLRTTSDLDHYLQELRRAGIPYSASVDKNYFRRREVLDAISLVLTVLDPLDQISLIGFLRSGAAGVPDAAWIGLWSRRFPEAVAQLAEPDPKKLKALKEMISEVASSLPETIPGIKEIKGWQWSTLSALEAIARLRKSFREDPHDVFVEKLRNLSLLEVTEGAKHLGRYRVANLERFFRWLLDALEKTGGNPGSVARLLRSSARQLAEMEQASPEKAQEDGVRVMTIHRAKGLDFSHLYIMQAHKGTREDEGRVTKVHRTRDGWECCLMGFPSLGYFEVQEREREISDAELVRTLYVAMTRAKVRLVIAGKFCEESKGKNTYANLLSQREDRPWKKDCTLQKDQSQPKEWRDQFGVLWRFLEEGEPKMEPLRPSEGIEVFPSEEKLEKDHEELQKLQEASRKRMERPWHEAMSEEAHWALEEHFRRRGFHLRGEDQRSLAMLVGDICHRGLESLDFERSIEHELERIEGFCLEELRRSLSDEKQREAGIQRIKGIFSGLRRGRILKRMEEIRGHIVARELPLLLAPEEDEGPVGFFGGAVDLLYRDPESGHLIVADYKTDSIATSEEMEGLCAVYSSQGSHYIRALKEMLGEKGVLEFELWFLQADAIRKVSSL
jgi:ATP-dependent helicase/nuclease subunit A